MSWLRLSRRRNSSSSRRNSNNNNVDDVSAEEPNVVVVIPNAKPVFLTARRQVIEVKAREEDADIESSAFVMVPEENVLTESATAVAKPERSESDGNAGNDDSCNDDGSINDDSRSDEDQGSEQQQQQQQQRSDDESDEQGSKGHQRHPQDKHDTNGEEEEQHEEQSQRQAHDDHDIELGATLHGDKERLPPPPPIDPTLPITPSRIVPLKKQGHKFLGCICDVRRAVFLFNLSTVLLSMGVLIYFILHEINVLGKTDENGRGSGDEYFSRDDSDYSDFWSDDEIPVYLPNFWIAIFQGRFGRMVAYVMTTFTLFYACLGILGTMYYSTLLVFGATCWPFVHSFVGLIHGDYAAMTISLLAVYPHAVLMYELYYKIMTRSHYETREDYCLCRHPRQKKLPMVEGERRVVLDSQGVIRPVE